MAKKSWISGAPAVAQVVTITVAGTPAQGQVYSVAMGLNNSKSVSYTAGATDTNATIATALYSSLVACSYPEFTEETWANPSAGVITATANTAGVPFSLAATATGTGTLTAATSTASSGPNDPSVPANWSTNTLPASGDDLYIGGTNQAILWNLDALAAVAVNSITWDTTFTGTAGLPAQNANGYPEYRPQCFQIAATTETFLPGTGSGSQLVKRDNGSAAWTVNANSTGTPTQQGQPALFLKGTNAANVLNVTSGYVGSATLAGESATWATVNVGYQQSQNTDVTLTLGSGCTLGDIKQDGGRVSANSAFTSWTQRAGTANFFGDAAAGTIDVESGTFYYQSSGAIATATIGVKGTLDFSRDPRTRTCGNCTVYGTLNDPNQTVTHTNPPYFPTGIGNNGATLNWGANFHLARS